MDKEMFQIRVYTTEAGYIGIQQDVAGEVDAVIISPDQLESVIRWLRDAKAELERKAASA